MLRGLLLLLVLMLAPSVADACSCSECGPATLTPSTDVPINLPAFFLVPMGAGFDQRPPAVSLIDLETGGEVDLSVVPQPARAHRIELSAPLELGHRYEFTSAHRCGEEDLAQDRFVFTAVAEQPLPASLGSLRAEPITRGNLAIDAGVSCTVSADAVFVDVKVELDPSAAPWLHALHFRTLVDGRPWSPRVSLCSQLPRGESWAGRGRDRLYLACDPETRSEDGLAPGRHSVEMIATLPFSGEELSTGPMDVVLGCDEAELALGDEAELALGDSGCSCRTGGATGDSTSPWLALLLGALVMHARSRRPARFDP